MTLSDDQRARLLAELDRCKPWIVAALPYCFTEHTWEDVVRACLAGDMQLWPGQHSAIVTELVRYPRLSVCNVVFAGGDLGEIRALVQQASAYAKSKGCTKLTVTGRPGWARALGFGRIIATVAVAEL